MSEVRWDSSREIATQNGFIFLYSVYNSDEGPARRDGAGLLLSKIVKSSPTEWHPNPERTLRARLKGNIRNVTVIQCYAPTEGTQIDKNRHFICGYLELSRSVVRGT
jgi:hypothetical protein